jgi:long-chain fatty acid transport protein
MNRRILSIFFASIVIVALALSSFASNGTQIGTVGAKSTAMGSAFRGLADDWSAAFFNPAGITQFGKWQIGASLGYIMPRGSYEAYPYPAAPFTGMKTEAVDATAKNFLVPALGIFYKPCEKWSVGLGVYVPFGLGTEWDMLDVPAGYGPPSVISKEKEFFSDHQVINVQPTVAYKVSEKLSVGLGLSYIWGKMTLDQVALPYNPVLANWGAINAGLAQISALDPRVPSSLAWNPDYNRLIAENNLDGSGSAYGANVGLLFKPVDKLSIGISGRFCTDLKLKGNMKTKVTLPLNATYYQALSTAAADVAQLDPANSARLAAAAGAFSGQPYLDEKFDDIKADLPLPWTIGLGIAYKPISRLTLTADASLTNWKSWDEIDVMNAGPDTAVAKIFLGWKNTLEIGAGAEYLAWDGGCKKLFIRLGGYTTPSPVPDSTMNPTLLDPNTRTVLTGGLGFVIGKIAVDVAFEHVMFADKEIKEYMPVNSPDGLYENFAGKYKFNANVITLGLTYSM